MSLLSGLLKGLRPIVERHPRAAMAYRHFRDLRDVQREPVTTPFGFRFVGNRTMESGTFERDETAFVCAGLARSDVFVNVGANIGYYCCFALQRRLPTVAFEPMQGNLRYLYRNVAANGWSDGIEVFPVAVGEAHGLIDIYGGGTAASLVPGWAGIPLSYRETVPIATLDAMLGNRLNGRRALLVVDVEGAELSVLRGARATLAAVPKPVWMVEIAIDEHQPMDGTLNPDLLETFETFERAGYCAWQLGATIEPLDYDLIRSLAASGVNVLSTHNFVFAESREALDGRPGDTGHA